MPAEERNCCPLALSCVAVLVDVLKCESALGTDGLEMEKVDV